jgi:hypothetical protein
VVYVDPNHYIKNLPLLITNNWMDNRRILIIAAIIIILISVLTMYLAPSDTIIPIPNPNENTTTSSNNNNNNNISTATQGSFSQQLP